MKLKGIAKTLWNAQGGNCFLCGRPMTKKPFPLHPNGFTRDHLWPSSLGGGSVRNIVLAHDSCNREKDNRPATFEEAERYRQMRGLEARHIDKIREHAESVK